MREHSGLRDDFFFGDIVRTKQRIQENDFCLCDSIPGHILKTQDALNNCTVKLCSFLFGAYCTVFKYAWSWYLHVHCTTYVYTIRRRTDLHTCTRTFTNSYEDEKNYIWTELFHAFGFSRLSQLSFSWLRFSLAVGYGDHNSPLDTIGKPHRLSQLIP